MGRKAIYISLAVLVALALAPAGASAANLTEERAFVLASKVGRQAAKDRDVRFWRIQRLVKRRTNRFVYEYFERLREGNRFCRASVVVVQSGSRRSASLGEGRCGTIRPEVLAIENAVGEAFASLQPKRADVRRSYNANSEELEDCVEIDDVPRRYENEVEVFLELSSELAVFEPVLPELDAFAARLADSGATDPALRRGVTSWGKYLQILRDIPPVTRDACPAIRQWARDNYSEDSKPVDFARTTALGRSLVRHGRAILDASDQLLLLGVSETTYVRFTPHGLVTQAAL